jgi:hypothetical protein
MDEKNINLWAIIELMGHAQTAGIIKTSDLGGLLRVDVPMEDGFRTEYYGSQAIYAIRVVSEEIARAFAIPDREICSYDSPVVPRSQFEEALQKSRMHNQSLQRQIDLLSRRLTAINALPEGRIQQEEEKDVERKGQTYAEGR